MKLLFIAEKSRFESVLEDIKDLRKTLKKLMKEEGVDKCSFELKGDAELGKVEELHCLFG